MGILKLFRKGNRKSGIDSEANIEVNNSSENKKSFQSGSQSDRLGYIRDNCEIIAESLRQIEEARIEYQAVTSYLQDMQIIDMIPAGQREVLEDTARQIINLTEIRSIYQNRSTRLTEHQLRLFDRYEIQLPKELPVIKESEEYQELIKSDLEHLEKEKVNLMAESEDIASKQKYLKGITVSTMVIVTVLFVLFALISNLNNADMTIPFLLTVLLGMATVIYIFMESRKNSYDIRLVDVKLNRAIILMNKTKLKLVNSRSFLDYTYSKYMAGSYDELKSLWEEYIRMKEEAKSYESNTELLEQYNGVLIKELKKFGVSDSEIWIYQPTAIIDNREMVEVRHRLNVRRQKLRERIDMNNKQKEEAMNGIKSMVAAGSGYDDKVKQILNQYRIQLDN